MRMTVKVGVLLVSLAVGVAGQSSKTVLQEVDDIMNSFLLISGISKESLYTENVTSAIRQDVTFWCCNSNTRTVLQTGIDDPQLGSTLDLRLPVIFLIHGYIESVERKWVQDSLRDLCQYRLTNACGVDWRRLAMFIYSMSAKHTLIVGRYVASFIQFLMTQGVLIENIILVGFSLGAHIAGIAGSTLDGEIPLIIGLDPSGPLKTYPRVKPVSERLDESDAKFVQAIYTCLLFSGSIIPVGKQNFYPAGGIAPQPWCQEDDLNTPMPKSVVCSHFVAAELFRRSINTENIIEGRKCSGLLAYNSQNCLECEMDRIGLDSKRVKGKFYFDFDTPILQIQNFVFCPCCGAANDDCNT